MVTVIPSATLPTYPFVLPRHSDHSCCASFDQLTPFARTGIPPCANSIFMEVKMSELIILEAY